MNFTLVNTGVNVIIQNWLNKLSPTNFTIGLYTTNHTPAVTDTKSTYTAIECSLPGYAEITLAPGSWTGSATAGTATYNYPAQTFTFTSNVGGITIYGAFIFDANGVLICAGLLDTAFPVPAAGGSLTLTLQSTES